MGEHWGWIVGLSATAGALLATVRGYVLQVWRWLESRVIITVRLDCTMQDALRLYLRYHCRPTLFVPKRYGTWYVTGFTRPACVVYEALVPPNSSCIYWQGWCPLLVEGIAAAGPTSYGSPGSTLTLRYLRGTFDGEAMLVKAAAMRATVRYARIVHDPAGNRLPAQRAWIRRVTGNGMMQVMPSSAEASAPPADASGSYGAQGASGGPDAEMLLTSRLISHTMVDLCHLMERHTLAELALDDAAKAVLADVRAWRNAEDWFRARGVPWRRGWLLAGPPGTGKTSLVRGIGEDLDMPIFVFDIATLNNRELSREWSNMLQAAPAIALIEDIDAVFEGRTNKAADGSTMNSHLTFDCLLNCLDGVLRNDGILTFITTNNPDSLDAALSGVSHSGIASRPGRIDRRADIGPLSLEARDKLAHRILLGQPEEVIDQIINQGDGDTAAQFQERCTVHVLANPTCLELTMTSPTM